MTAFDHLQILDALADAVIAADGAGRIVYINAAAETLLGWPRAEATGRPLTLFIPERLHAAHRAGLRRFLRTRRARLVGRTVRVPALRRDGTEIEVDLTLATAGGPGQGALFVASLRDVRERVEIERQLAVTRCLRAANRAAAGLSRLHDPEAISGSVAGILVSDFGASLARVWTRDAGTDEWRLRASAGESPGAGSGRRALLYPHAPGAPATLEQPLLWNGLEGDARFDQEWVERSGTVAAAVFPLRAGSEVLGAVACFSAREYLPEELEVLETFSAIAAGHLHNARLFRRSREQRERLESFTEELLTQQEALQELNQELETVRQVGISLAAELDLEKLVQAATDAGTRLTGARFGAFFYNVMSQEGEAYRLYTLSGVPREVFAGLPMPRNTDLFGPTFRGERVVRLDDVTRNSGYSHNPPYQGVPPGHPPVRSYLAVPVISRSGEVLGGLFFGHPEPGRFTERHERIVLGIAGQASVALDNARLFQRSRESERLFRAVFDSTQDAMLIADGTPRYLDANPAACALLGTERDALLRRSRPDLEAGADAGLARVWEAVRKEAPPEGEIRLCLRDGTLRDLEYQVRPDFLAGRHLVVLRDITEHRRLEEALRQRADELAEASRRKDEFLAMLAHELRNPLAAIANATHVLDCVGLREAQPREQRAILRRQTGHLSRMIEDLLDASSTTLGRIALRPKRLDLGRLVRETVCDYRPAAEAAGLRVRLELSSAPLWVEGDATRLAQVIGNLLHNAVKYTEPGGRITVRVAKETRSQGARRVTVSVRDTGVGISPELLPRIWERFVQEDRSLDRQRGGLGLGLPLVRQLVEAHGGEVRATSAGPGLGSEFTLRLPLQDAGASEEPAAPSPGSPAAESRRILVVEDNPDVAASLRELLELSGHAVEVAGSGPDGLETARRWRPEIIFCDIGLPRMDGYAVARAVRQDPALAGARLVALTGYGSPEDRRLTREAGFDLHLVKPVQLDELLAAARGE